MFLFSLWNNLVFSLPVKPPHLHLGHQSCNKARRALAQFPTISPGGALCPPKLAELQRLRAREVGKAAALRREAQREGCAWIPLRLIHLSAHTPSCCALTARGSRAPVWRCIPQPSSCRSASAPWGGSKFVPSRSACRRPAPLALVHAARGARHRGVAKSVLASRPQGNPPPNPHLPSRAAAVPSLSAGRRPAPRPRSSLAAARSSFARGRIQNAFSCRWIA